MDIKSLNEIKIYIGANNTTHKIDKKDLNLNRFGRYHDFKQTRNNFLERVYEKIKNENPMP